LNFQKLSFFPPLARRHSNDAPDKKLARLFITVSMTLCPSILRCVRPRLFKFLVFSPLFFLCLIQFRSGAGLKAQIFIQHNMYSTQRIVVRGRELCRLSFHGFFFFTDLPFLPWKTPVLPSQHHVADVIECGFLSRKLLFPTLSSTRNSFHSADCQTRPLKVIELSRGRYVGFIPADLFPFLLSIFTFPQFGLHPVPGPTTCPRAIDE